MIESRPVLHLQHVRLRTADREQALLYRLRLSRLLGAADLLPAGIPPPAVLVMRRLEDPLPGRLSLDLSAFLPPPAWEGAVRRVIEETYRRAARPQRGRLPSAAQAVLFTDEAQLMACLALAILQGRLGREWWWQSLLPVLHLDLSVASTPSAPGRSNHSLAGVLRSRPEHLPAVLGYLEEWGEVLPVVSALAPAEARRTLEAMLQAYGLSPQPGSNNGLSPPAAAPPSMGASPLIPRPGSAPPLPDLPPWHHSLLPGSASARLGRERSALLGVGLTLARRPGSISPKDFQTTLQRWWQGSQPGLEALRPSPRSTSPRPAPELQLAPPTDAPGPASPSASHASETAVSSGAPRTNARWKAPAPDSANKDISGALHLAADAPEKAQLFDWSAGVETALGGAFFLLNLMHLLDIPATFEAGWGLESQVGAWGVFELLARALLAQAGEDFAFDPLWRLLAELDNRPPGTILGRDFIPSGPGGLPPGWEPAPPRVDLTAMPLLQGHNPALLDWLSLALPPLRRRLLAALGLAEPEAERLPVLLLVLSGRLHCTRSHLDLVLRIEDARIPVRQAGLDANPGWLPRFGRIVTFHFL